MSSPIVPHNSQNYPESTRKVDSVNCVHGSERSRLLIAEFKAAGIVLSIDAGRLAFDAPAGMMTHERLARLRADREAVVAALQENEKPLESVPESDEMPVGVHCPFCNCRRIQDDPRGMRCRSCSGLAWLFLANGSVVRADYEKTDLTLGV